MALHPNNMRSAVGWNPNRHGGASPTLFAYKPLPGAKRGVFTGQFPKSTSIPDGYAPSGALVWPYTAGGMSSWNEPIKLDGSASLLSGGPMEGSGSITLTAPDAGLSMIVSLGGTSTITIVGDGIELKLTVGLNGAGTITLDAPPSSLAMIVPFDGTGQISLNGTSDLKGRLSLAGDFNLPPEFSAESLAAAVWDALTASYTKPGSFGAAISGGAAGLTADQVWDYLLSGSVIPGSAGDRLKKLLTTGAFVALKD